MKAFVAAVIFAGIVAFAASSILTGTFQTPTHAAFTTEGARVNAPGSNLMIN